MQRGNITTQKDSPHIHLQLFSPLMPEIPYLHVFEKCLIDVSGACSPRYAPVPLCTSSVKLMLVWNKELTLAGILAWIILQPDKVCQPHRRMLFWQEHALAWSHSCQGEEVAAILRHSARAEPRGNAHSPWLISQGRALNSVIITVWQKKIKSIILALFILKVPGLANQPGGKKTQNLTLA